MKIVIDNNIPFIRGVFEASGEVVYLSDGEIDAAAVHDADVLIVRTRTRCDAALLAGSQVRLVVTATIGFDHIDMDYCQKHGIRVETAAGCNARGVAQWVFAALVALRISPRGTTLGIIGVGNVGSVVRELAQTWGFDVVCYDPPRKARNERGTDDFTTLTELLARADVVTIHTLLDDTTRGMVSDGFFTATKQGVIFLNSSRGEIVDEAALRRALQSGRVSRAAIDVWQDEPAIDRELLSAVTIATPHIAGYSLQGKAIGTAMSVRSVASFLSIPIAKDWYPEDLPAQDPNIELSWNEMASLMPQCYDIMSDDAALRDAPERFESLRGNYRFRSEFF